MEKENKKNNKVYSLATKNLVGSVIHGILTMLFGVTMFSDLYIIKVIGLVLITASLICSIWVRIVNFEEDDEMALLHETEANSDAFIVLELLLSVFALIGVVFSLLDKIPSINWVACIFILFGFINAYSGFVFINLEKNGGDL